MRELIGWSEKKKKRMLHNHLRWEEEWNHAAETRRGRTERGGACISFRIERTARGKKRDQYTEVSVARRTLHKNQRRAGKKKSYHR